MQQHLDNPIRTSPKNACAYCSKRKRSCDRRSPKCTTCLPKNIECEYVDIVRPPEYGGRTSKADSTTLDISSEATSNSNASSTFPPSYFLDHAAFLRLGLTVPTNNFAIISSVLETIGDLYAVATKYFSRIHWWMPIISQTLFYADFTSSSPETDAELYLVLLAMSVIIWKPSDQPSVGPAEPKTPAYITAKHAVMEAIISGALSLRLLQAQIVLAMYEFGHAIFPSAYLSIATCARYGVALGIDRSLLETEDEGIDRELKIEEKRRMWWTILILDRFTQLGNPNLQLSTVDPDPQSCLPRDHQSFDDNTITDTPFTVGSAASIRMGMFARMAQASYLMGHVIRHNRDRSSSSQEREAEKAQLDRTLRSLLNLSYVEGQVRRIMICQQSDLCYSTLMALHDGDTSSTSVSPDILPTYLSFLEPVRDTMSWDYSIKFRDNTISVSEASPLLLHWAYQASNIYRKLLYHGHSDVELQPFLNIRRKLEYMSRRWLAGREYLKILDTPVNAPS